MFPGTNSEEETVRFCRDVGLDAQSVHWSRASELPSYDAYVMPGGFAYEDRVRAGAIPAHDPMMDYVIEGAARGKLVLGICNGAQILLEAGLVPGNGRRAPADRRVHAQRPRAAFYLQARAVQLAIDPQRCAITAALERGAVIPAWAAHGQGRLAASAQHLGEIGEGAHVAFTYAGGAPNGSALNCAGLVNREGNVLALMPHPERDAWDFNHPALSRGSDALSPSGGSAFFESFAKALES